MAKEICDIIKDAVVIGGTVIAVQYFIRPKIEKKIDDWASQGGFVYPGPMHEAIAFHLGGYWDAIKEKLGYSKSEDKNN